MRFIESRSETVEKAQKHTEYNLYELVGNEVNEWDQETEKRQAYESAQIILNERQNHNLNALVYDRALTMLQNDMSRVPKDHLTIDSEREMVKSHHYWPNDMNKWDCRELLEEWHVSEIPTGYYSDAYDEVVEGIVRKLRDY